MNQNSNYRSAVVYQNHPGGTSTLNEYAEQKGNMLKNVPIQGKYDLSESKYQNIAKMSQYSQSSQHVSFNYRPTDQYPIERNNNFIN